MSHTFTLNKLSLTEHNITHADLVRHIIPHETANHLTLDEVTTPFYDVNAPYFVSTDTHSGKTQTLNTVQLAEVHQNFELIDQLMDMGLVRTPAKTGIGTSFQPSIK